MSEIIVSPLKENDCFKKRFQYYKSKVPKPSFQNVIVMNDMLESEVMAVTDLNTNEDARVTLLGLSDPKNWKLFSFKNHPGLMFIRNPFTALGQRYWITRCLKDYPKKPNKINIDIEIILQDWWSFCVRDKICDYQMMKKLRWTTMGYHHNWDTKVYSEDKKSDFPSDLAELSDVIASYLGFDSFKAEAAIVNYYHMNSTLSPHTDHSEVNLNAPLISFSFGQSAIFLIGGAEKSIEPSAVLLQSGDIVVMSKEARLCYHAVPKILHSLETPWNNEEEIKNSENSNSTEFKYISNQNEMTLLVNENVDEKKWFDFNDYIAESRININVRQVLNDHQSSLDILEDT